LIPPSLTACLAIPVKAIFLIFVLNLPFRTDFSSSSRFPRRPSCFRLPSLPSQISPTSGHCLNPYSVRCHFAVANFSTGPRVCSVGFYLAIGSYFSLPDSLKIACTRFRPLPFSRPSYSVSFLTSSASDLLLSDPAELFPLDFFLSVPPLAASNQSPD